MYQPTLDLMAGIRAALPLQLFPWDHYFATMAQTDFLEGHVTTMAVKSFFIRQAPFDGSYALAGGISESLRTIMDLDFSQPAFAQGMQDMGLNPAFVQHLQQQRRLRLQVYAPVEGSLVFPREPFVSVVGPLPDVCLAEGILTEALNFATLSLTKWHRLVKAAYPSVVLDFSRRRAQHHLKATLYAMLAGCSATSNAEMRRFFDVPVVGTIGHEWMSRYGDVQRAYQAWLRHNPHKPIGLVDTKQCLQHDFPLWLDTIYEQRERIKQAQPALWGWRNDSGDLAYLSIEQYSRFRQHPLARDPWFHEHMRIVLTNELDEYAVSSITSQIVSETKQASMDPEDLVPRLIWAAGTKPGTCWDQPSLGGVAKLVSIADHACIKLAFDAEGRPAGKTTLPGFNRSALVFDEHDEICCVLIYPHHLYHIENGKLYRQGQLLQEIEACHPINPNARLRIKNYHVSVRQELMYDSLHGTGLTSHWNHPDIHTVVTRVNNETNQLHWSMRRLDKPHKMKVSLTPDLFSLYQAMTHQGVLREDFLEMHSDH